MNTVYYLQNICMFTLYKSYVNTTYRTKTDACRQAWWQIIQMKRKNKKRLQLSGITCIHWLLKYACISKIERVRKKCTSAKLQWLHSKQGKCNVASIVLLINNTKRKRVIEHGLHLMVREKRRPWTFDVPRQ